MLQQNADHIVSYDVEDLGDADAKWSFGPFEHYQQFNIEEWTEVILQEF